MAPRRRKTPKPSGGSKTSGGDSTPSNTFTNTLPVSTDPGGGVENSQRPKISPINTINTINAPQNIVPTNPTKNIQCRESDWRRLLD